MYNQYRTFSRHHNYGDGDKLSCLIILGDRQFELTEYWSAKMPNKLIEKVQQCSTWLQAAGKHITAEIVFKKSAQFCKGSAVL